VPSSAFYLTLENRVDGLQIDGACDAGCNQSQKQRVSVDYDDDEVGRDALGRRTKVAFEGWMTEIRFAADLVRGHSSYNEVRGERRFDGG